MNQCFLYESTTNEFITNTNRNFFRDKEISYTEFQNAYALPSKNVWQEGKKIRWGGLVDENGIYITNSGRFRDEEKTLTDNIMMGGYPFKKLFCRKIKGQSIYCGEFLEHWGHFLLESTTRLWYVVKNRQPNQKLIFVARKGLKLTGNFKHFFEILGVSPKDVILITKPTKLESVIVPEASSALGNYYTKEFADPFIQIQKNVAEEITDTAPAKRLYLSRRKCKIRFIMGEESIENVFKENGFQIVYPELLSLKELIALFQNAEYVAGISGTAMHNALFCPPTTKLIILNRTVHFNQPQGLINQAMHLDTIFTDAHFNFLPTQNFYWLGITPPFQKMCQTLNFKVSQIALPTTKEAKQFFDLWLKDLPKIGDILTLYNFKNASEIAQILFSQMTATSPLHQKMDLLKYTLLSKISWGANKRKYLTNLQHYREKYGVISKETTSL